VQNRNQESLERGFSLIELLVAILLTSVILIALYDLFDTNNKIFHAQQEVTTMNLRTRTAMAEMVTAIRTAGSNNLNAINLQGKPFVADAQADSIRVVEDLPKDSDGDGSTFDRTDRNTDLDFDDDDEDDNGDGYINDKDEDVTFSLNGTNLIKTQYVDDTYCPNQVPGCTLCPGTCPAATSEVLATDIDSLTFEYFINTAADPVSQVTPPVTGNDLYNISVVRITLNAKTHSNDRLTNRPHTLQLRSDVFLRN
jgi:prepilin-type N-terminal cleavage/methylation domain-containing protein